MRTAAFPTSCTQITGCVTRALPRDSLSKGASTDEAEAQRRLISGKRTLLLIFSFGSFDFFVFAWYFLVFSCGYNFFVLYVKVMNPCAARAPTLHSPRSLRNGIFFQIKDSPLLYYPLSLHFIHLNSARRQNQSTDKELKN